MLAGICVLSAFAAEKDMMRALLDEHQAGACAFIGQVKKRKAPSAAGSPAVAVDFGPRWPCCRPIARHPAQGLHAEDSEGRKPHEFATAFP